MNNRIKTFAAVAALGVATISIYPGTTLAKDNAPESVAAVKLQPAKPIKCHTLLKLHRSRPWNLGLRYNKHLSEADARTITKAALLMHGRHHLRVGDMQTTLSKRGYKLYQMNIVNKKNKIVSRVVLNSRNGHIHPLHNNNKKNI